MVLDRALKHYDAISRETELLHQLEARRLQEEAVRTVFQRFVPEQVVETVLGEGGFDKGTPERRDVTVMFSDLRKFTTLCSQETPPRVLRLLNEYFDMMTAIIERWGGSVNQFIGDALFAVFGAPVVLPEHERAAMMAALEMRHALRQFNKTRAMELIGQELSIGIGLQRGQVAVGNVGAPDKVVYAAIGDAVYEVEQVEAACKGVDNAIVATRGVADAAGAHGKSHGELPGGQQLVLVEGV